MIFFPAATAGFILSNFHANYSLQSLTLRGSERHGRPPAGSDRFACREGVSFRLKKRLHANVGWRWSRKSVGRRSTRSERSDVRQRMATRKKIGWNETTAEERNHGTVRTKGTIRRRVGTKPRSSLKGSLPVLSCPVPQTALVKNVHIFPGPNVCKPWSQINYRRENKLANNYLLTLLGKPWRRLSTRLWKTPMKR